MPFLTISNANVNFQAQDLQWRSYTTGDVLPTTKRVKLIRNKEFTTAALDPEHEAFIVHVATLSVDSSNEVHPSKRAQIADLKADEASSGIPGEYGNFADIFSPKLAAELPEHTEINDHAIELVDDWQPLYGPIYSLGACGAENIEGLHRKSLDQRFHQTFQVFCRSTYFIQQKVRQ